MIDQKRTGLLLQKVADGICWVIVRTVAVAAAAFFLFVTVHIVGILVHGYEIDARLRQIHQQRHPRGND